MKSNATIATRLLFGLSFVALSGCAHDGTYVTLKTSNTEVVNATDQAILADAIDQAFEQLDMGGLRTKVKNTGAVTAYLEVSAPFELSPALMGYIENQAGAAAGRLGLSILEVLRTTERISPERTWEVVNEVYPETDARVVMLISHAGVDEISAEQQQTRHASREPDGLLKGRFKGTFTVAPRKTSFDAFGQTIIGEATVKFVDEQHIDKRGGWFW